MSERDGWNHLYLYDGVTGRGEAADHEGRLGRAQRPRTSTKRSGRSGSAPAGCIRARTRTSSTTTASISTASGLTPLTQADANHVVNFSTDRAFYVDTYSRVDAAPVSELRRADGTLVTQLEAGDIAELKKAGWKAPEVFTAKGRDGKTDIWGVIYPAVELRRGEEVSRDREHLCRTAGIVRAEVLRGLQRDAGDRGARLHRRADRRDGHQQPIEGVPRCGVEEPRRRRLPRSHRLAQGGGGEVSVLRHHARRASTARRPAARTRSAACSSTPSSTRPRCPSAGCHDNRMDKIWWNEQWMGWPIGPEYAASSNVDNAHKLQGKSAARGRRDGQQRRSGVDVPGRQPADQAQQELRPAGDPQRGAHVGRRLRRSQALRLLRAAPARREAAGVEGSGTSRRPRRRLRRCNEDCDRGRSECDRIVNPAIHRSACFEQRERRGR